MGLLCFWTAPSCAQISHMDQSWPSRFLDTDGRTPNSALESTISKAAVQGKIASASQWRLELVFRYTTGDM